MCVGGLSVGVGRLTEMGEDCAVVYRCCDEGD